MDWLNILGAIGGSAGLVALIKAGIDLYNAKGNKTKVDISNMETMLKDAMTRNEKLEEKFDKFQKESHAYVESLRGRIVNMEERITKQETRLNDFEKVVNSAWRCDFPPSLEDCPVFKEYEKRRLCEDCGHKK